MIPPLIDRFSVGPANYTGRPNGALVAGATDARTAIQNILTAAADVPSTGNYFDYLGRRCNPVVMVEGHYFFDSVEGAPVLSVPPGVTFDFSRATFYYKYPTTVTNEWCGIQLGQQSKCVVGKMFAIGGTTGSPGYGGATDVAVYDAIRIKESDGNSTVAGLAGESEIRGFRGAGVRSIASWNVRVKDFLVTGCAIGVAMSKFGTGFSSVGRARSSSAGNDRCTAHYITNVQFANIGLTGILASCSGNTTTPNAVDSAGMNDLLNIHDCSFENVGGYVLNSAGAVKLNMRDCRIEECGRSDAVINLSITRAPLIEGIAFYLTGRSITRIVEGSTDDTSYEAQPADFVDAANCGDIRVKSVYSSNTFKSGMNLVDERGVSLPSVASYEQIVIDSGTNDFVYP